MQKKIFKNGSKNIPVKNDVKIVHEKDAKKKEIFQKINQNISLHVKANSELKYTKVP